MKRALPSSALLRSFLWDELYNPTKGYFICQAALVQTSRLGGRPKPLPFHQFANANEYFGAVSALYRRSSRWKTPVGIFAPYYGEALASYIASTYKEEELKGSSIGRGPISSDKSSAAHPPPHPLVIYEIGGGNGTCALNILDFFEKHQPHIYNDMFYELVDISPRLCARQRALLHHHIARNRCRVRHQDIMQWRPPENSAWTGNRPVRPFVIALELFDNMPHDKVVFQASVPTSRFSSSSRSSSSPIKAVCWEAHISEKKTNPKDALFSIYPLSSSSPLHHSSTSSTPSLPSSLLESYSPLLDPLIAQCLSVLYPHVEFDDRSSSFSSHHSLAQLMRRRVQKTMGYEEHTHVAYVPTCAFQLLQHLLRVLPQARFLFSDFCYFPVRPTELARQPSSSSFSSRSRLRTHSEQASCYARLLKAISPSTPFIPERLDANDKGNQNLQQKEMDELADLLIARQLREGENAPIIHQTVRGESKEYRSYLMAPRHACDIYFPTNFSQLRALFKSIREAQDHSPHGDHAIQLQSNASFMLKWANCKRTRTKNGYNPLIEDYANTCFFIAS